MKTPELSPRFSDKPGAQAAWRLFEVCRCASGGTKPIAAFLTSMYNNCYAQPDAYLLCRRIDDEHFDDVLTVMTWFREQETGFFDIHEIFGPTGATVMEDLMSRFGFWDAEPC
ncbi:DUF7673 family protein [Paraburkholderia aromaticivorans]|uniref:DUF7673 family protein n=1 Tax=Paraburkholderia aromaticivorans TaxID=2026199 RepID=UPI001455F8E3|nr:hypothetical protein [Paraburkholderia aromaticivorans]